MFCRHCGNKIKDTASFCPKCGNSLGRVEKDVDTSLSENIDIVEEISHNLTSFDDEDIVDEYEGASDTEYFSDSVTETTYIEFDKDINFDEPSTEMEDEHFDYVDEEEDDSDKKLFITLTVLSVLFFVLILAMLILFLFFKKDNFLGRFFNTAEKQSTQLAEEPENKDEDKGFEKASETKKSTESESSAKETTKESSSESSTAASLETTAAETSPPQAVYDSTEGGIHRYEFIVENCSWTDAFQRAKSAGGYLVRVNSKVEYQHLLSEINRLGLTNIRFFIGGRRDIESNEYYWVDTENKLYGDLINSPTYWASSEWMSNEPSFSYEGAIEQYLEFHYYSSQNRWIWNDVPNDVLAIVPSYSSKIGYIIEYDN